MTDRTKLLLAGIGQIACALGICAFWLAGAGEVLPDLLRAAVSLLAGGTAFLLALSGVGTIQEALLINKNVHRFMLRVQELPEDEREAEEQEELLEEKPDAKERKS